MTDNTHTLVKSNGDEDENALAFTQEDVAVGVQKLANAPKAPAKKKMATPPSELEIPAIQLERVNIHIVGLMPLISNQWSKKAREEMLAKQMGKARAKRPPKNPEQDFEESIYRLPDGRCAFPSVAFKKAAVDAATHVHGLTKTYIRGCFHIAGAFVPIEGTPQIREDMVRNANGVADIRHRAEYPEWSAIVPVLINVRSLSIEQLTKLFDQAGFSMGIGDWRPEKDGVFGLFAVTQVDPLGPEKWGTQR